MSSRTHIFNNIEETLATLEKKANAMETTMPDDPTGNGLRKAPHGSTLSEYDAEYKKLKPVSPDAPFSGAQGLNEDNQQAHSGSDFEITESGQMTHAQDICDSGKGDFDTTMPATLDNAEKYAAYHNFSFNENCDVFYKAASILEEQLNAGIFGKEAAFASGIPSVQLPDETWNYLNSLSDGNLEKTASDANDAMANLMYTLEMEKAAMSQLDPETYNMLNSMSNEELSSLIKRAEECIGECSSDVAEDSEPSDEEAAALESLSPDEAQALGDMSIEDLVQLIEDSSNGEVANALEANPDVAEGLDAVDSLPDETVEAMANMPEEKLASYAVKLAEELNNVDNAIAEEAAGDSAPVDADLSALGDVTPEELEEALQALEGLSPEEQEALASLSPEDLAALSDASTEGDGEGLTDEEMAVLQDADPETLAALENMDPEDLAAAADSLEGMDPDEVDALSALSPEEISALEQMSPEELAQIIEDPEAGLGAEGASEEEVTPDEAVNELSSAMTENGVTPDDLDNLSKEGGYYAPLLKKYASLVRQYRDEGRYFYTRPLTSKSAELRKRMGDFLYEITRK